MHRTTLLPLSLAAALAVAGCGSAHESKTGAARAAQAPVTELRVETVPNGDAMQSYADAVARASKFTLAIRVTGDVHHGDPAAERKLIADVQAGRVPLAIVGARAFDAVGVRDFDALVAPFLITSYDQQQRVLQAPLAGRMLASLDRVHLTGLTLLPGPFRRMLGVHRTYLDAGDFRGTRVGMSDSRVAAETLRALGAVPVPLAAMAPASQVDGFESQLAAITGNGYIEESRAVTMNLAFWPRPLVVVGNPAALARLTPAQRRALGQAGAAVLPAATAALAAEDEEAAAQMCEVKFALKRASPAGLRSIERAVQPVYRELSADPATRRAIAEIRALGGDAEAGPTCGPTRVAGDENRAFDGVYRMSTTAEEVARRDHVAVADVVAENYGDSVLVIDGGHYAGTGHNAKACTWQYGRISFNGNQMEMTVTDGGGLAPNRATSKPGERFVGKPRLYRGRLTVTAIKPAEFATTIWKQTSSTPSRSALDQRCHPPAEALPR